MRFGKEVALGALMLTLASGVCHAASTAVVSGVVRDTQGVAQMGAVVEVLAAGSVNVATAFTDIYGRYRIANLVPGKYRVRATAALFVPATRNNLQLSTGMRATVNLTLNMLSDPAAWLTAKRRGPTEPGDDWTWTLRSAADRPILRMLDDGEVVLVSGDAEGRTHGAPIQAHGAVASGAGGFGQGGVQSVITLDRKTIGGTDLVARGSVAFLRDGEDRSSCGEVDAGYQRKGTFGGASRLVMSYASHPEIVGSGGVAGLQMMKMESAEQIHLGDTVDLEAGGTVYAIHMAQTALTGRPFLSVTVHPGEVWAVQYRLATSREVQGYSDLDSLRASLPTAVETGGAIATERGSHQEIAVSRKLGNGQIRAAMYHDGIERTAISGTGAMDSADLLEGTEDGGVVVDPATDSFRMLGKGYSANGITVSVSEPMTAGLMAVLEYASGVGLAMRNSAGEQLSQVTAELQHEAAQSVSAGLDGHLSRTGTKLHAEYRYQPHHLITSVASYDSGVNQAYFSFYIRQALRWGDRLPPGLDATVDVTNLLAEGYQPFLSADGRTLYLAQAPRTVQGGLSFTF